MTSNAPALTDGKPRRIAILLPNLVGGGVERVRLLLAEQFLAKGFAVDFVLAEKRGELLSEVPPECHIIALDAPRLRSVPVHLRSYLMTEQPDAVLAAMWPLTGLAGLAMRWSRSPARLVVSEHTDLRRAISLKPLERKLLRLLGPWFYGRASKVVAISRGVSESLQEVARLPEDWIEIIRNPIRQSSGGELDARDQDLVGWWEQGAIKLIAVGSLKEAKDYPTLLKAIELLRHQSDARLIILGEGPDRSALESFVECRNLSDSVRLPGFRASPYPFLRRADCFVLSSRWEGLANVITEALACGCRVVSTDCPSGPAELLANGRYGALVPPGDPEALAHAIAESAAMAHDPEEGRDWAKRFNPEAAAEAYLRLLFPG